MGFFSNLLLKRLNKKENDMKQLWEEKGVRVGDRVRIVSPPQKKWKDERFEPLIGKEGIIVEIPSPFYSKYEHFYSLIWYEGEALPSPTQTRVLHTYLEKLDSYPVAYQHYLQLKKAEEERKYRTTCPHCQQSFEYKFQALCPTCDKPQRLKEKGNALPFIPVINYLQEITGDNQLKERLFDYVVRSRENVNNDSFQMLHVKTEPEHPLEKELKLIKKTWKIKENSILLWISW